ncbi:ribosomal protein S18-alanine N-acetyltransferase [soil metagenome]
MTTVCIQPLQPTDLPQVVAIERQVYDRPWSEALFASELAQPTRRYLAARADTRDGADRLLGYGGVMDAAGEAHITTVVVDPDVRRRKVASRLVLALLDAAVAMGTTAATLEVRAGNHGAQRLYSSFGFAPVGVRPGYYAPTGEDAIIMWLYDLGGPECTARLRQRRSALATGLDSARLGEPPVGQRAGQPQAVR